VKLQVYVIFDGLFRDSIFVHEIW